MNWLAPAVLVFPEPALKTHNPSAMKTFAKADTEIQSHTFNSASMNVYSSTQIAASNDSDSIDDNTNLPIAVSAPAGCLQNTVSCSVNEIIIDIVGTSSFTERNQTLEIFHFATKKSLDETDLFDQIRCGNEFAELANAISTMEKIQECCIDMDLLAGKPTSFSPLQDSKLSIRPKYNIRTLFGRVNFEYRFFMRKMMQLMYPQQMSLSMPFVSKPLLCNVRYLLRNW